MLAAVTLLMLAAGALAATFHPTENWNGGFKADLHIPICADQHGYRIHFKFNQDIDSLDEWVGQVEKINSREFVISNAGWDLHNGDSYNVVLIGHCSGCNNPSIDITIEGMSDCGGGGHSGGGTHTGGGTNTGGGTPQGGGSKGTKDYADALKKSILFYDAQRAGKLPANNPIPWRGDSFLDDCVVGGWFDAGDHVKFGLPFGAASHCLMWSLVEFKAGYEQAGQTDMMYDMIKWATDYILNAWNPGAKELVAQIGDGNADHSVWDRPENIHMNRPCMKVNSGGTASDIAGDWAAAAAAGYLAFKDRDAGYAGRLLNAAKTLYDFGKGHQGVFGGSAPFYGSSGYKDELCIAAMWLYRATGQANYLNEAKQWHEGGTAWALGWDDQKIACQLFLYEETQEGSYKAEVEGFLQSWMPGGSVPYTPCGQAWRDKWGSNRYAGNSAYVALAAAEAGIGDPAAYRKWAVEQINYLLGDNHHDGGCFSYEIGYGSKFPRHPHHRGASTAGEILQGALVGGPDQGGNYNDVQDDYVHNEVAIDYNMGFQSALAAINKLQAEGALPATSNKCAC
ncbi:hypothetical protein BaRGS_00010864 [Batillaria attramentaria]|uniref:cellulase n=1 Tax=Batillaria attramentaria TaxID=370345 RepID=A0ABD0LF05_9CAEN